MPRGNPNIPPGPGRPKGSQNKTTREAKTYITRMLADRRYRASLRRRLMAGEAPLVEKFFWEHGAGKPKDTLALEHETPMLLIDALSEDEVLAMKKAREV